MPKHSRLFSVEIGLLTIVGAVCVHAAINHQMSIKAVSSWKTTVAGHMAATALATRTDAAAGLAQSQALPKIHLASQQYAMTKRTNAMSNAETDIDQYDEEEVFTDAVTDEALEATCGISLAGVSTLAYGSYCFTCVEHPYRP